MLMLLFYVGDECYALSCRRVVEVISLVELKKVVRSPNYVAGLLNYRGKIIPVIDLCQLMADQPYRPLLSTRIIVVNYLSGEDTSALLGLIAERITETLDIQETDLVDPGIKVDTAPYLGEIITDRQGMIQCIQVESLLSESQRKYLLAELE
jgi:chemotaxis-related protein WspB